MKINYDIQASHTVMMSTKGIPKVIHSLSITTQPDCGQWTWNYAHFSKKSGGGNVTWAWGTLFFKSDSFLIESISFQEVLNPGSFYSSYTFSIKVCSIVVTYCSFNIIHFISPPES